MDERRLSHRHDAMELRQRHGRYAAFCRRTGRRIRIALHFLAEHTVPRTGLDLRRARRTQNRRHDVRALGMVARFRVTSRGVPAATPPPSPRFYSVEPLDTPGDCI